MSISESIKAHREARGMTQQQPAERLYITRQAVSRWETGETTPGIDMTKLIAATLDVPIAELLDMPPEGTFCQSCGMYLANDEDRAQAADGTPETDWCKWCVEDGELVNPEESMEELIERCAPYMVESGSFKTVDEAASLLGVVLPQLKRWRER